MREHLQARSNITLDEFYYRESLAARLKGLKLEKDYYVELRDATEFEDMREDYQESISEINEEFSYTLSELIMFNKACARSYKYHRDRV